MRVTRRSFIAIASASLAGACTKAGEEISLTSPTSGPSAPVMAPPPPGVSAAVWAVAFWDVAARKVSWSLDDEKTLAVWRDSIGAAGRVDEVGLECKLGRVPS